MKRRPNGSGTISNGYWNVSLEDGSRRKLHILIVEAAIGKSLPEGAEVHHVDENRLNNEHSNLVVCPSRAYHKLLHQRMDAFNACGNYSWRKCPHCKTYDDPSKMSGSEKSHFYHKECKSKYDSELRVAKKALKNHG